MLSYLLLEMYIGVVGSGEGVVYLTSQGRPTDIGQLLAYSWARPVTLVAGKGTGRWGGGVYFFCFFTYIPVLSFSSVPLFHLLYYLSSSFAGRHHKMTHKDLPQHNQ